MKIGTSKSLGIVTHCNPVRYRQIIDNLSFKDIDKVYVIDTSPHDLKYAQNTPNISVIKYNMSPHNVGKIKNSLIKNMIDGGYEHLFLMEDGIVVNDGNVFDAYIETARQFGLWGSLNYAWRGNNNLTPSGMPKVRNAIQGDGLDLIFTENLTSGFSYIHKSIIENSDVGYFDEFYNYGCEEIDFYFRQTNKKLASYFWWFTDIEMSAKMLSDVSEGSSAVLPPDQQRGVMVKNNIKHFNEMFSFKPVTIPVATKLQVLNRIDFLSNRYGC